MPQIGTYCKAYLLEQLRQYPKWQETTENQLTEESVLYLQENYVVTTGIYVDENIIFNNITPEWQQFCHQTLKFSLPS
ncbi:hypothetical protein [Nostoc sp. UHCC 0870]|jgi:hypothetical protein|uniref:hypothetical protein n=1 Tax=Nostoc sp. UHCC 0870 TaxID=2914041 RepID=UPI001EDF38A6|nr:hypothetical protein [Nostoc sp. UHCC 0870]UKP00587.1 hypothetical protein L6494_13170 [Nostoc sp. UHCC 0870]